jgi:hypothetical protein
MNDRPVYEEIVRLSDILKTLASGPDDRLFNKAERVSAWSVADHLDHLALSNLTMVRVIEDALAEDATAAGGLTVVGRLVMLTGWIPRGRGKAPEFALPEVKSGDELRSRVSDAREAVLGLAERLPQIERSDGRRNHFAFGDLTPSQWLRVIEIHTRHHLKIIDAIERNR